MSTIKNNNVEEILQKLKFHMKFDTWKEVAEYLGVSDGVISAWKKRNTQSAIEKILYRCSCDVDKSLLLGREESLPEITFKHS